MASARQTVVDQIMQRAVPNAELSSMLGNFGPLNGISSDMLCAAIKAACQAMAENYSDKTRTVTRAAELMPDATEFDRGVAAGIAFAFVTASV